uniref:Uncharacterized protein n=1 Tax=Callithrix jacchus TaxID=9483 RepID=A0A8I3WZD4_CALJA
DGVLLCCPGCSAVAQPPPPRVQAILLPPASQVDGITGTHYRTWIIFVFLVEMGFHHVGWAGLKLLTSGDPPTLAFQSAGITDVSYHTLPRERLVSYGVI